MPKISIEQAHKIVMILEGGDKLITDAGGLTKWGISQKAYPEEDIAAMTEARSFELFQRDYWNAVKADFLPSPLNLLVADMAFNQGPNAAVRALQTALDDVAVDGILGKVTLGKANSRPVVELCARFMTARLRKYAGTRGYDKTGAAWYNRCGRLMMHLTPWVDLS